MATSKKGAKKGAAGKKGAAKKGAAKKGTSKKGAAKKGGKLGLSKQAVSDYGGAAARRQSKSVCVA